MSSTPLSTRWILLAHGSRLEAANQEVRELAGRLTEKLGKEVKAAFLEIASPSLEEALDQVLSSTPKEIFILPYFLTQGRHLAEDIPRVIRSKAEAHPEISIRLLDYVGSHPGMVELLAELAGSQRP
jgi:sirohydrochlorin cobaltochelatase